MKGVRQHYGTPANADVFFARGPFTVPLAPATGLHQVVVVCPPQSSVAETDYKQDENRQMKKVSVSESARVVMSSSCRYVRSRSPVAWQVLLRCAAVYRRGYAQQCA